MRRAKRSKAKQFTVKLAVPMIGEISGVWEPVDAERKAAWELYVELVTRVAVVELGPDEGVLREAMNSLYSLFATTRDILRRYGPEVAPRRDPGYVSFGALAVTVLNGALRPLLTRWHPVLTAYEAARPAGLDPVAHEHAWAEAERLREDLRIARETLTDLGRTLAEVAGAGDLMTVTVVPKQRGGGERLMVRHLRVSPGEQPRPGRTRTAARPVHVHARCPGKSPPALNADAAVLPVRAREVMAPWYPNSRCVAPVGLAWSVRSTPCEDLPMSGQ
ncbi:hypothetical protein FHX73_114749 [Kitasatospora viridis]|uniref:Uncharacterized protein n=1 Tax=Kitasatospora viridis TaxID=281105 RepID=A0A561UNC6_9ACTN|nr:hypothetical protein FHX73_114749 [Kitasatospora viridis]